MAKVGATTVQKSDGNGKEAVLVSGCFCAQGSVAPARGEEVKENVCRMCGVLNDVLCPLPGLPF